MMIRDYIPKAILKQSLHGFVFHFPLRICYRKKEIQTSLTILINIIIIILILDILLRI